METSVRKCFCYIFRVSLHYVLDSGDYCWFYKPPSLEPYCGKHRKTCYKGWLVVFVLNPALFLLERLSSISPRVSFKKELGCWGKNMLFMFSINLELID
ncbi:hypothetical protein E2320_013431 [Naja naja]|nr:hypothetical protein E2320_013431 [Naja naja]